MTRRTKLLGLVVFNLINLAGGAYAFVVGELMHGATHAVLLALGALALWRLTPSANDADIPGAREAAQSLDNLQTTVDSIAHQVERIGEAQRFEFTLLEKRGDISPPPKKEQ
jgi:hypothetical protein